MRQKITTETTAALIRLAVDLTDKFGSFSTNQLNGIHSYQNIFTALIRAGFVTKKQKGAYFWNQGDPNDSHALKVYKEYVKLRKQHRVKRVGKTANTIKHNGAGNSKPELPRLSAIEQRLGDLETSLGAISARLETLESGLNTILKELS